MQIVHKVGLNFRMMAVVERLIDMRTGTITCTNIELAAAAGHCSKKTISREVTSYERLGLFICQRSRKKTPTGNSWNVERFASLSQVSWTRQLS